MTRTPIKSGGRRNRPRRDYKVGYGKPPIHTRFKPGGVGNPKGRPRKKQSVGEIIEAALMMRVTIEENGRARTITAQEFIFRNLVRAAARGDTKATQTLFALRERYKDSPQTVLDVAELAQDDRNIIENYLAALPAQDGKIARADEADQHRNDSKAVDPSATNKPTDIEGDQS
jgi:Family of unknown function (DUF5681)